MYLDCSRCEYEHEYFEDDVEYDYEYYEDDDNFDTIQ